MSDPESGDSADESNEGAGGASDEFAAGESNGVAAVREAVREVRREWYKAAVVEASVAAAVALATVNLALSAVEVPGLPDSTGVPALGAVPTAAVLGVAVGAAAFAGALAARLRRPAVEAFERANPSVAEALRTARDASLDDERTPMAAELYADVIARLRGTSSLGLLDRRRLAGGVLLVAVLAVAAVQVAASGFAVDPTEVPFDAFGGGGPGGEAAAPATGGGEAVEVAQESVYGGLQSPEDVLGEPENVTAGSENLTAVLGEGGGGDDPEAEAFEEGGLDAGSVEVDAQRAGFVSEEPPEDADVIREYNRRIRQNASVDPGSAAVPRTGGGATARGSP